MTNALTRGARRYAPGIFGGAPVYTPDEVNLDDEDGNIITVSTPPSPVAYIPAAVVESTTDDDEAAIAEASVRDFVKVAAEKLATDTETIKARLHALGYTNIPGDPRKRVDMYRRLYGEMDIEQSTLLDGPIAAAAITNGAYEE